MNKIINLARPVINKMKEYSPGKPIWEVQEELGIPEVIKLSSNENPLGVSPLAKEAIAQYVTEIHRYPDANTTRLRNTISDSFGVSAEQIIVGNGADEIIKLISETFLEEGDEIIIPTPSFSEYEFGANLMAATVRTVPLGESFEYDLDAFLTAVNDKTKLIYLCSPNNPTGTYIKRADLKAFLEKLPRDVIVVFDGAYSQYATSEDYTDGVEFIEAGSQIIVIQTFSKIYGLAGIRVGFGVASVEVIKCLHKVREPFNVNTLAQVAATAAISDVKHVENSKQVNAEGRDYLYNAFEKLGIAYTPSMANFILVDLGRESKPVYESLLRKGIIVRYGGVWGLNNHLRITIGTENENKAFIRALEEIL